MSIIKKFAEAGNINVNAYMFFTPEFSRGDSVENISLINNNDKKGFVFNEYKVNPNEMASKKDEYSWFYDPINAKRGVWSDVYTDPVLKIEMITYTTPIILNGQIIGVVGMDIKIDSIQKLIKNIKLYDTGYAFLMNKNYKFISNPKFKQNENFKTVDKGQYSSAVREMGKSSSGTISTVVNGSEHILAFSHLQNGYIMAVSAPKSEILKDSTNLTKLIIIFIVLGELASIFVALYVGHMISKPIKTSVKHLKLAATGDFTVPIPKNILKRKDETGQLALALSAMQSSLNDLIKNVQNEAEVIEKAVAEVNENTTLLNDDAEDASSATEELVAGMQETA